MFENHNITSVYGRFRATAVLEDVINNSKFRFRELEIHEGDEVLTTLPIDINNIYTNIRIGLIENKLYVFLISDDNTIHMTCSDNYGNDWTDIVVLDILTVSDTVNNPDYIISLGVTHDLVEISLTSTTKDALVITDLIFIMRETEFELVTKKVNEY